MTATQTATGFVRITVSNETGSYVLPNLPLGPYTLEGTLPGFQTFLQTGIVLQVGSNPSLDITLEVGQVTQTIEVQANAALVETRNVSIGQVTETARIVELPLNGRNVQELLLLSGGAVAQNGSAGGGMLYPGRLLILAAGTLGTSTETKLDGITHKDTYDGQAMPFPFPDALAEFRTEIGGQEAKEGQGATVSAVTRSGTNEFHGNLFWFHRNDALNAIPYFSKTENSLKRNQFGGTFGGPIAENRLLFFGGFQRTTNREDSGANRDFVSHGCDAGRRFFNRCLSTLLRPTPDFELGSKWRRAVQQQCHRSDSSLTDRGGGRQSPSDAARSGVWGSDLWPGEPGQREPVCGPAGLPSQRRPFAIRARAVYEA